MAVITPWAINAEVGAPVYDAQNLRRIFSALMAGGDTATSVRSGIVDAAALEVTLDGSTIDVAAGTCLIDSPEGPYVTGLSADSIAADFVDGVNTLDPADVTDDRIDIVVFRVFDDDHDSSGVRAGFVEYIAGTAAPAPVAPVVPARSLLLATIDVPSSGTGSPAVTDERELTWARQPPAPTIEVFTSSGTWSKPPGCKAVRVRAIGGGGGGGGAAATAAGEVSGGGGGSGGSYAESIISAGSLGSTVAVTVGTGGSGGSGGANGNNGGSSSFGGAVVAPGGQGGLITPAVAPPRTANGGTWQAGGAGSIVARGGVGGAAVLAGSAASAQVIGGAGGDGPWGGGGLPGRGSAGTVGSTYGGGGGGAANQASQVARSGGGGADGVVIVETFF